MSSVNRVFLIGYAGKDAELRYLSSGTPRAEFSLATSWKAREGAETTDWHNITWFGDNAEKAHQYVRKGGQVCVEGRISYRTWDDDQGAKHYRTEIIADRVTLLGKREGGGDPEWQGASRARPARGQDIDVDDLPFE